MAEKRLTPDDWVLAGIAALAAGGLDAVRIEPLARGLKTSKGSFYWHFADRPALLAAMLLRWETEGTHELVRDAQALDHPADRLWLVLRAALVHEHHGISVARLETARRAWAADDAEVGARLRLIDEKRAAFLATELGLLGYAPQQATQLGAALYMTLLGLYATRAYAPALADDANLIALLERLIATAPGLDGAGRSDASSAKPRP